MHRLPCRSAAACRKDNAAAPDCPLVPCLARLQSAPLSRFEHTGKALVLFGPRFPIKLSGVVNVRTYPDTSADLRLRNVILLSNCVRRIVDTFRVHSSLFDIGAPCSYRAHPALIQVATLCALTLQALSVCAYCYPTAALSSLWEGAMRLPRHRHSLAVSPFRPRPVDASLFDRAPLAGRHT